jgi:hypothetical protein
MNLLKSFTVIGKILLDTVRENFRDNNIGGAKIPHLELWHFSTANIISADRKPIF